MGADEHPHSDSTMVIVGVDLNHRSPGYEPGGIDLATLPRSGKIMFSANLNVSDHSGVHQAEVCDEKTE